MYLKQKLEEESNVTLLLTERCKTVKSLLRVATTILREPDDAGDLRSQKRKCAAARKRSGTPAHNSRLHS